MGQIIALTAYHVFGEPAAWCFIIVAFLAIGYGIAKGK